MRLKLLIVPIICIAFVTCQQSTNEKKQNVESEQETSKIKVETTTKNVLADTIGIHKITNSEARDWIVDMSKVAQGIEQALNNNNPSRMPSLMEKASKNQRSQLAIQSNLSESDRTLFKSYANKLATKLSELGDRMSNM
ncbi:hypothetical protein R9C00_14340 [Flammeovirgaceae bacterium SG7u.111]|nr:hypothetical protein [Flammeovirgaceae bacterium SG7u.132]WPO38636.1 hypothetical protein R9C00_14340 [Flammeovirgaceae bacterium SG7u.111]